MTKRLREGFTTGTAVAAAAKTAVALLFNRAFHRTVDVPLPPFSPAFQASGRLDIPLKSVRKTGAIAYASVVKNGGDDPDATHGIEFFVQASLNSFDRVKKIDICLERGSLNLAIATGRGIGRVTLPGLPVAIGEPAYNPEPRKQLLASIFEVLPPEYKGQIFLYIEVPSGEDRAKKTLNGRLGIVGGISILGTHGTVRPYSHEAFTASIAQGFDVASAIGVSKVLLATGRRSERLLFFLYPDLPPQAGVQVADHAAFSLRYAASKTFERLIWGCFPGKLVKLAQGLEWTHANGGEPDLQMLAKRWVNAGGDRTLTSQIEAMPTAVGAFSLMEQNNQRIYSVVLLSLAQQAHAIMGDWIEDKTPIMLHVFSMEGALLCSVGDDDNG